MVPRMVLVLAEPVSLPRLCCAPHVQMAITSRKLTLGNPAAITRDEFAIHSRAEHHAASVAVIMGTATTPKRFRWVVWV